jgi:hypothetical protein
MILGCGLMILLDEKTQDWKKEIILLVAGIGMGGLFTTPLIVMQVSEDSKVHPTRLNVDD